MTAGLTPTQAASVEWMTAHRRGLLIGGMGSGKTCTTLEALARLAPSSLPALVVAPAAVSDGTWSAEAARISSPLLVEECPRGSKGGPAARRRVLEGPADVVVISSASIEDAVGGPWATVVADEASQYRRAGTKREKALRRLAAKARGVWLLTGTPGDDPIGLWTLARILDGGQALGARITQARDRWLTAGRRLPSGAIIGRAPRRGAIEEITSLMAHMVRVVPDDGRLEIPGTEVTLVPSRMPASSSGAVRTLRSGPDVLLCFAGVEQPPMVAGVAAQAAVQLTTGAMWDVESMGTRLLVDPGGRTTMQAAAATVLSERERTGRGVLVEYWYRHELPELRHLLEGEGAVCGRADRPEDRRRWNSGTLDVLLAHPASTGHGLNLQAGGESVVWSTLPWSLELWEQACARLARPGQEADEVAVRVMMPTLDDGSRSPAADVFCALEHKADVQDAVVSGLRA